MMWETIEWIAIAISIAGFGYYCYMLQKRVVLLEQQFTTLQVAYKTALKLIMVEKERRSEHAKALKRLTDPEAILEDMKKGERMREMRDANRTTLPREDAGPPAKVYTPTLRANVPKGNFKRNQ